MPAAPVGSSLPDPPTKQSAPADTEAPKRKGGLFSAISETIRTRRKKKELTRERALLDERIASQQDALTGCFESLGTATWELPDVSPLIESQLPALAKSSEVLAQLASEREVINEELDAYDAAHHETISDHQNTLSQIRSQLEEIEGKSGNAESKFESIETEWKEQVGKRKEAARSIQKRCDQFVESSWQDEEGSARENLEGVASALKDTADALLDGLDDIASLQADFVAASTELKALKSEVEQKQTAISEGERMLDEIEQDGRKGRRAFEERLAVLQGREEEARKVESELYANIGGTVLRSNLAQVADIAEFQEAAAQSRQLNDLKAQSDNIDRELESLR